MGILIEDYIQQVQERSVQLIARTHDTIQIARDLGGVSSSTTADAWRIGYDTEDQLASLLQALRDAGIAFAGGAGWPPAAVAEMLRDKGKLHGVIREATWLGPNQQVIEDR